MKKLLICAVLALSVSGCASTGGSGGLTDTAKEIQSAIKIGCNFVPTLQTILALISKSGGSTLGIVNEVCLAITSVPLADGGKRKVIVRGVPIAGRRV